MTTWKPYQPTAAAPWNLQRVHHLHRRAAEVHDGPDTRIGVRLERRRADPEAEAWLGD